MKGESLWREIASHNSKTKGEQKHGIEILFALMKFLLLRCWNFRYRNYLIITGFIPDDMFPNYYTLKQHVFPYMFSGRKFLWQLMIIIKNDNKNRTATLVFDTLRCQLKTNHVENLCFFFHFVESVTYFKCILWLLVCCGVYFKHSKGY